MFTTQLLADWQFDDAPGSTAAQDSSGGGHHLSLSGMSAGDWVSPATTIDDNIYSLQFGSDTKYGAASSISNLTADSVSFWIKPDSTVSPSTPTKVVAELGSRSDDNLSGTVVALGPWTSSLTNESVTLIDQDLGKLTAITNLTLPAGKWAHLAFVWNTGASRYDAYVNGQLKSVVSDTAGHVGKISVQNDVRLGQRSYPTQRLAFNGAIDEFRLFNGSLTAADVRSLATPFESEALVDAATWNGGSETYSTQSPSVLNTADEFVRVDVNQPYKISGWARSGTDSGGSYATNNLQYFGFTSYDIDYQLIESRHVNNIAGSQTHLAQDLRPGDTVVYLDSASGWNNGSDPYHKVFAWYGYTDSTGHVYPDYSYTRNVVYRAGTGTWAAGGVNTTANTITLSQPWSGPELKAGDAVANHFYASSFNYTYSGAVSNTWTEYQATISGVAANGDLSATKFRAGTAYIKPLIMANYHGQSNNLVQWRDVEWSHGSPQPANQFAGGARIELHTDLVVMSGPVTYNWEQISGPPVVITNAQSSTASFIAPWRETESELIFQVTVSDGTSTFTDTVTVDVEPVPVDVRYRLETVDLSGNPITSVEVGEQFKLKVYIEDVRHTPQGPFGGHLDVTFDSNLVDIVAAPDISSTFNLEEVTSTADGLLDEVGGSAPSLQPLGSGEKLLLETLMIATSAGSLVFRSDSADDWLHHPTLVYGVNTSVPSESIEFGAVRLDVLESVGGGLSPQGPEFEVPTEPSPPEEPETCFVTLAQVASQTIHESQHDQVQVTLTVTEWCGLSTVDVDVHATPTDVEEDGYHVSPVISDEPITLTLTSPPKTYTFTADDDVDSNDELISMGASVVTPGVNATTFETQITVDDDQEAGHMSSATQRTTDESCSCSCQICPAIDVSLNPASGSAQVSTSNTSPFSPIIQTAGDQNAKVVLRQLAQFPANQALPGEVVVNLVAVLDDDTEVAVAGPYTYPVDSVLFDSGDKFEFGIVADLGAVQGLLDSEFQLVNLQVNATARTGGVATGQEWNANVSHLVRDLSQTKVADGLVFPFLKTLVFGETLDSDGVRKSGIGVFRGDNTASWYAKKSPTEQIWLTPPETLSELTFASGTYKVAHRYGDYDLFDSNGRHWKYVDRNGNETVYGYDTEGRLTSVVDPFQRTTTFSYVGTIVMRLTDFAGRMTEYSYATASDTLTVTSPDPDGILGAGNAPVRTFDYTDGRLTTISSSDSGTGITQTTTISYDDVNDDGDGRIASVSRTGGGSVVLMSRPWREDTGSAGLRNVASGTLTSYSNQGQVKDAEENITTYKFDDYGRVIEVTDALGQTEIIKRIGERGDIETITTPDPDDFTTRSVPGVTGDGPLDPLVTTLRYDSFGNVVFQTLPNESPITGLTNTWEYGPKNQVQKFINELGHEVVNTINTTNGNIERTEWKDPGYYAVAGNSAYRWQNPLNRYDVNVDGFASAQDVLVVINDLNNNGARVLPGGSESPPPYFDTNTDNQITSFDALVLINFLNAVPGDPLTGAGAASAVETYTYLADGRIDTVTVATGRSTNLETDYDYYAESPTSFDSGRLMRVTYADGSDKPLTMSYAYSLDTNGGSTTTVTEFSGALERVTQYRYDALDRLVAVLAADPDGTGPEKSALTRFQYDAFGNQIAVEQVNYDPLQLEMTSQVTCFGYDSMNRLVRLGEDDALMVLTGDDSNLTTRFAGNLNVSCSWLTTPATRAVAAWNNHPVTEYGYDANGNMTSITDALGRTTEYRYDALNRLEKIVEPVPTGSHISVTGEQLENGHPVMTFVYDNVGNLWSVKDSLGNETHYRYDSFGRLITQIDPAPRALSTADAQHLAPEGDPTKLRRRPKGDDTTPPPGVTFGASVAPVSTFNYVPTAAGWRTTVTDPANRTAQIDRDFLGRVVTTIEGLPTQFDDPELADITRVTMNEYYRDGLLKAVVDGERNRTEYGYNAQGLLQKITSADPDGSTGSLTAPETSYLYDSAWQLTDVTDPMGRVTKLGYDMLGRTITVTSPDLDAAGGVHPSTMRYTFDSMGNLLREAYVIDPGTGQLGQPTTYEYDHLYRRTLTTDANGDSTQFSYDLLGNLTKLVDPNQNATVWNYDELNRVRYEVNQEYEGATPPANATRSFKYDAAGNVREKTDRNGRNTKYEYDKLYRLTAEKWTPGGYTVSYAYNMAGELTSAFDLVAPTSKYDFTYDALGRQNRATQANAWMGPTIDLYSAYDLADNRVRHSATLNNLNGPGTGAFHDFVNTYSYDRLHRMTSVTQQGHGGNPVAEKHVTFDYNPASQMTDVHRYQATSADPAKLVVHTHNSFDPAGRLTSIVHSQEELASGTNSWLGGTETAPTGTLAAYHFTYDVLNQLDVFDSWKDKFSVDYGYDNRGQLTSAAYTGVGDRTGLATLPTNESYSFDDNGNRLNSDGNSQSPIGYHNRIVFDGTYTYAYDNEGNRTARFRDFIPPGGSADGVLGADDTDITEYTWDHRNRLTSVIDRASYGTATTQQVDYTYDVFDRRIAKTLDADGAGPGGVTRELFAWDGDQIALQFTDTDGNVATPPDLTHRYLYGDVVDMLLAEESGTDLSVASATPTWPLGDHLNSTRDIVQFNPTSGQTIDAGHINYDSFGKRLSESTAAAVDFLIGFTGRDWDKHTQLQDSRERPYDPRTHVFLGEDPIMGDPSNTYRYVENSPTMTTDPFGLDGWGAIEGAKALLGKGNLNDRAGDAMNSAGAFIGGVIAGSPTIRDLEAQAILSSRSLLPWAEPNLDKASAKAWRNRGVTIPADCISNVGIEPAFATDHIRDLATELDPSAAFVGEAFAPVIEDAVITAITYGARPPIPRLKSAGAMEAIAPKRAGHYTDFADEAAAIMENAARSRGLNPNAGVRAMAAPVRTVELVKLVPPPTRCVADPGKLQRLGQFDWSKYKPIQVEDIGGGRYMIMDGMTRVEAARRAGITKLPVQVFPKSGR